MKKHPIFLLCILFSLLFSCSDSNNKEEGYVNVVTSKVITMPYPESEPIIFHCNAPWKVKCYEIDIKSNSLRPNPDWLSVSQSSGSEGQNDIVATVKENKRGQRFGAIEIVTRGESETITVLQPQRYLSDKLIRKIDIYNEEGGLTGNIDFEYNFDIASANGHNRENISAITFINGDTVEMITHHQGYITHSLRVNSFSRMHEIFQLDNYYPYLLSGVEGSVTTTEEVSDIEKTFEYSDNLELLAIKQNLPFQDIFQIVWEERNMAFLRDHTGRCTLFNSPNELNNANIDMTGLFIYTFSGLKEPVTLLSITGNRSYNLPGAIKYGEKNQVLYFTYQRGAGGHLEKIFIENPFDNTKYEWHITYAES